MEQKHTPGPWVFEEEPNGQDDAVILHEGCPIATVRGTNDMSCIDEDDEAGIAAECKANAELIASAPETAKRAQEYADKIVDLGREKAELLAALKMAEIELSAAWSVTEWKSNQLERLADQKLAKIKHAIALAEGRENGN